MADDPNDTADPNDAADAATGLSQNDLRAAALTVCAYSTDVDDARELLEALGLVEDLRAGALAS